MLAGILYFHLLQLLITNSFGVTNIPKGYLANGLHPILSAASAVIKTTADAPSDSVDAFPAVMVPPSFWKTVASLPNLSKLTFLYSSSSDTTTGGWPRFVTTETLKSSSWIYWKIPVYIFIY